MIDEETMRAKKIVTECHICGMDCFNNIFTLRVSLVELHNYNRDTKIYSFPNVIKKVQDSTSGKFIEANPTAELFFCLECWKRTAGLEYAFNLNQIK